MYIDMIGWVASLVILFSLFMKNMSDFRWYNLAGHIVYVVYGYLACSAPVTFLNIVCAVLNLYYLYRIYHQKDAYSVCQVQKGEPMLTYFLNYYKKDICTHFPDFSELLINEGTNNFLVLCNNQPIGVFILEKVTDGELSVVLDYVAPNFRNYKAGLFIHHKILKELAHDKVQVVISRIFNPVHRKYLQKIGYTISAANARMIIR